MKTPSIYFLALLFCLQNCEWGDKRASQSEAAGEAAANTGVDSSLDNYVPLSRSGSSHFGSRSSKSDCGKGISPLKSQEAVEKAIKDGRLVTISLGRAYEDHPTCIACIDVNRTLAKMGCEKPSDYAMYTLHGDKFGAWFTGKYGKPKGGSYPYLYFFRDGKLVGDSVHPSRDEDPVRKLVTERAAQSAVTTAPKSTAPPAKTDAKISCPTDDPCVQKLSASLRKSNGPAGAALLNKPLVLRFADDCPNCEAGANIHGLFESGGPLSKGPAAGNVELAMFYFKRNPNSSDYTGTTISDAQEQWKDPAQWSKVKHRYTGSFAESDLEEMRSASACGDFAQRLGDRFDGMRPNLIFDRTGNCTAALSVDDEQGVQEQLLSLLEKKTASSGSEPKEAEHKR